MTAPMVGVLVPVRLETRFVPPAGRQRRWRIRVRVIPDAVSITNHDDVASSVELDAVEAMWRAAGGGDLESPEGRRAWRALAAAMGAERAAWLARTFAPVTTAGQPITIVRPAQTRKEMRAPKVMGLPPTMEIWMARAGQAAAVAATLLVQPGAIDLDLDDPNSTNQPWWTSFPEAVRVGLAAEIDLGVARPMDIDALYVVGIGGGDPGPLLANHANSGQLGIVATGSSTSTVNGEAALPLGDVETWRRLVPLSATAQRGTVAVSTALAGAPIVRGVVGGEANHLALNRALVGALWPALWGHSLANVWGFGSATDELGVWAQANLVPEGPLPSLRIGNLPYGLLPATSLRRWQGASGDPAIEARLVPLVRQLVATWALHAEQQAAVGPSAGLGALVRTATATRYAWRWMMPTTLAQAVSFRFNQPVPAAELGAWWAREAGRTPRLEPTATPTRQLVSIGWGHDVGLPLVEPADLPTGTNVGGGLARLAGATVTELLGAGGSDAPRSAAPGWGTSLLTELARHSLLASAAAVARTAAGQGRAVVEPVSSDRRNATETETWASRLRPTDVGRRVGPTVAVRANVIDGLRALSGESVADIDRGLRAALDTATQRIDPWATAIAWRRLQELAAAPRSLGVYGWVDAPQPRQSDGDHRYVLAPSTEQAVVAALLRDRALRDPDADRWHMDLTSDAIRGALRLADETRLGSHPAESLGRAVEAIVKRPAVIDALRMAFPSALATVRADMRKRRVCDGVAVLDAVESQPTAVSQLGVSAADLVKLADLAAAVDAFADMHVAEAALGVVKGRSAMVAAATTAAAGQGVAPNFDVVRTPRSGRVVNTVAVVVLPDVAPPTGAHPSPAAVADAAVAAYLDDRGGDPTGAAWTWATLDATGQPLGTVTLADIGLRPCDTVGLGTGNLRRVVRDVSGVVALGSIDPPGHATVRALAAALAGIPAVASDVGVPTDRLGAGPSTVDPELAGRYVAVRMAASAEAADARMATVATATDAMRRAALGRLARWGITPLAADGVEGVGETGAGLANRLRLAIEVLERRVASAPASLDDATAAVLASSMGLLVAPEGPWPVFSRLAISAFDGVRAEPLAPGITPRLDPDWIEAVAPVRPAIARLEAMQLGERVGPGGQPLRTWSNRAGDPWQTAGPPLSDTAVVRASRLVAVFGPAAVLPARPAATTSGTVAVVVIDRFAETVPNTEHISAVAFPHDVPRSRAPQAVILAVPPIVDEELTAAILIDIVADVRMLARTRMADVAAMGAPTGALHLAAMPAGGRVGVELGGR